MTQLHDSHVPHASLVCAGVSALIVLIVQSPPVVDRWPRVTVWGNFVAAAIFFVGAMYAIRESFPPSGGYGR